MVRIILEHFSFVPRAPSILVLGDRNVMQRHYRFYLFDKSWYFSVEHMIYDLITLTGATSYDMFKVNNSGNYCK